jgi:hypothetical protein
LARSPVAPQPAPRWELSQDPVGTIAGAAVGAVVGGLAGHSVAKAVNPSVEDAYWRENHRRQSYAKGRSYDDFGPAYRTGYEGYALYGAKGCTFEDREVDLRKSYEATQPKLAWDEARPASRAAWQRFRSSPKGIQGRLGPWATIQCEAAPILVARPFRIGRASGDTTPRPVRKRWDHTLPCGRFKALSRTAFFTRKSRIPLGRQ